MGTIYLLKSTNWIKIGYTDNFQNRIKHYKQHNPKIELIYKRDNLSKDVEKKIIRYVKSLNPQKIKNKEWFYFENDNDVIDKIINYIDSVESNNDNYSQSSRKLKGFHLSIDTIDKLRSICSFYGLSESKIIELLINSLYDSIINDIEDLKEEIINVEDELTDNYYQRYIVAKFRNYLKRCGIISYY